MHDSPPPPRYRRGRFSPALSSFIAYGFRVFSALSLLLFLAFFAVSAQAQTAPRLTLAPTEITPSDLDGAKVTLTPKGLTFIAAGGGGSVPQQPNTTTQSYINSEDLVTNSQGKKAIPDTAVRLSAAGLAHITLSGAPAGLTIASGRLLQIEDGEPHGLIENSGHRSVEITLGYSGSGVSGTPSVTVSVGAALLRRGSLNDSPLSINNLAASFTIDAPDGVIISAAELALAESGAEKSYTVALKSDPGATVTVTATSGDGSAAQVKAPGGAFGSSATLTFTGGGSGNWGTPQTIAVRAPADSDSQSETVTISHGVTAPQGNPYRGISAPSVTAKVTDATGPGVSISASSLSIIETNPSQKYQVSLNTDPGATVTVTATSSDGSALRVKAPTGALGSSATLTFTGGNSGNWNTPQTITVEARKDSDTQNETVTITHAATVSNTNNPYHGITIPSVTANVTDSDGLPVVMFTKSVFSGFESASRATIEVRKTGNGAATIAYATEDVEATAGADYTATSGTLSFGANETQKTISVPILNDNIYDPSENFRLRLSVVAGTSNPTVLGSPQSTLVTIIDNDPPPATLTLTATSSIEEGGEGTVTATLSRSLQGERAIIPVRIKAGANVNDASFGDHALNDVVRAATITITQGTTRSRPLYGRIDNVAEGDETVVVEAYNLPPSITLAQPSDGEASITVKNRPAVRYSVSGAVQRQLTLAEGATAQVTVTTSEAAPSGGLAVPFNVFPSNSATATSADVGLGTITIPQGMKRATGTLSITDDILHEGDERATIGIDEENISDGVAVATPKTRVHITDNDPAPTTATLSFGSTEVLEGTSTPRKLTATLGGATRFGSAKTVRVRAAGSGKAGVVGFKPIADFDLEIPAGAQAGTKTVQLQVIEDDEVNENETLTFSGTLAGVTVSSATLTLLNDDKAGNKLSPLEIYEGERLTFTYEPFEDNKITSFRVLYGLGTADYGTDAQLYVVGGTTPIAKRNLNGFSTAYEDIAVSNGVVQFDLEALADNVSEGDEMIRISIIPGPYDTDREILAAKIVLKAGVRPGEVSVSEKTLSITEQFLPKTYEVVLTTNPNADVTVTATSGDGSAVRVKAPGGAFGSSATLTFTGGASGNWNTPQTFTVQGRGDNDQNNEQGVRITHAATVPTDTGNPYHGVSIDPVTVNVTDSHGLPVVGFGLSVYTASEARPSKQMTLTVKKTGNGPAKVAYATEDLRAKAGEDYRSASGTLSFGASDTEKNIVIALLDDLVHEGNEDFRVILSIPSDAADPYNLGQPRSTTGIIIENDPAPSTLVLSVNKLSIYEGESARVVATLTPAPLAQVIIPVRVKTGSENDISFSSTPNSRVRAKSITIVTGTTNGTDFIGLYDSVVEADETAIVEAYNLPPSVRLAKASDGEASIVVKTRPRVDIKVAGQKTDGGRQLVSLAEGATAEVTATLSESAPSGGAAVSFRASAVTNPGDGSYVPGSAADISVSSSLAFAAGATTSDATATLTITDDNLYEGPERVRLAVDAAQTTGASAFVGVHIDIEDNDAAPSVALSVSPATVAENAGATTVTVRGDVQGATRFGAPDTIAVSVAASGAQGVTGFAAVEDFDLVIPAAADAGSTTFTLTPTNDNTDQADETITISGAAEGVTVTSATLTLEDDDMSAMPTISIRGGPGVLEGDFHKENPSFTLTASPAPTQNLDVTVTIMDAPGDFLQANVEGDRTVTIPANKGSHTFTVRATNSDTMDEPSGDVTATVKPGAGYTVGTPSSGATRIFDGNGTQVTLSGAAGNVTEGNAKTFKITLNRGLVKGETIFVTLSAAGTATRGTDYTLAGAQATGVTYANLNDASKSPKVTFTGPNTGVSAKEATITLMATADAVVESTAETVNIGLSVAHTGLGSVGTTKADNLATFSIPDQTISIAPGSGVDEGAAASFTVRASAAPSSDLDVTVRIEDAATSDFVTTANEGSKMVTIAAGQRTATYSVATTADNTDEPNGNVTATVESGSGYQVSSTSAAASVAVADDDATTLTLAAQTAGNVTEGGAKTLTLTLGRALVAGEKLTAPLAFAGAATRGTDYTLAGATQAGVAYNNLNSGSASVVFTGPSPASTTITFSASTDNASEGSETVEIGLGALATTGLGGGATGTNNLPSFSITDPATDPTITISAGSGVTEGTALSFTLTANPTPTQALDVAVTIADAANSDFVPSAGEGVRTVTIDANSATKTFAVATTADTADEPNGKVTATVTNGSGYAVGSPSSAEGSVNDNDATTVTLSTPDKTAKEGDASATAMISLTLGRALRAGETLAAPLQFSGGAPGAEFTLALSGNPTGVTFASATSTVTFEGPTNTPSATEATLILRAEDDADEDDETVTVSIPASSSGSAPKLAATGLGGGAAGSRTGDGAIAIEDDDVIPEIAVSAGSGVDEGTAASFTLSATPVPTQNTNVRVTIAETGSGDFVAAGDETTRTVTISAGSASQTFTVATTGDNTDEPNGYARATLASAAGYTIAAAGAADSVAVADDDATSVTLAGPAGNVTEGGAKALTLTLGRTLVDGETLTAPLTFAGTATRGADYALAAPQTTPAGVTYNNLASGSASVLFTGPSAQTAPITFRATADANAENPPETVTIGLGAPAATGLGGGATQTNNLASFGIEDPGAEPTITVSAGAGVEEGAPASFTLNANPAPSAPLAVTVKVDDAASSDFVAAGGEGNRTVTLAANQSSAPFAVVTNPDAVDEPNGAVTATVIDGAGYAVGSPASAEVAVDDNDATTVTLSTPDKTATEDDAAATATLTLTLSRALTDGEALAAPLQFTGGDAGTHFTLALSGTPAGVTFDAPSSTVTFAGSSAPSATEATLTLAAQGDADAADRTVTVSIPASSEGASPTLAATNLGGGATGGRAGDGEITITDDDEAQVSFLAPAANATEASGTVNVQVVLDPAPPTNITIAYALGGDATRNEDYAASGTVTATAGDTSVEIPVSVTDDDVTEASETIVLTLENGAGYAVGTPNTHTLTVADNDAPGVIANPLSLTVNEGGLAGTYTLRLETNPGAGATVTVTPQSGDKGAATTTGALTFDSDNWQTPQPVTVTPEDDSDARNETVDITHTVAGYGSLTQGPTVTVAVADDEGARTAGVDASPLTLNLSEGGAAGTYALVLRTDPGGTVTVTPQTSDAGAATLDTKTSTGALEFDSSDWQTPKNVTVIPEDDNDARNERVSITHTVAGYGGVTDGPQVTVAITDDDEPTPTVAFATPSLNVSEAAGTVAVTINLDPAPSLDVTITYAIAGDAAIGEDYSISGAAASAGTIVVAGGSATADIIVSIADDSETESAETILLTLQDGAEYDVGTVGVHTLTLADNDTPAVTASPLALTIEEGGSDGSYAIRLATNPGAEVTVTPRSSNEQAAIVSGALTFDSGNWQSPQNVRVTPVDDSDTGDETVTITHTVAGYAGVTTGPVVAVTVIDATGVVSVEREQAIAEAQEERAEKTREIPTTFALEQNYPNPFNPTTTIEYALDTTARVTLTVYDVLGRKVRTVVDDMQSAARYSITFDANGLASGTYLYVLATDQKRVVRTMLLIK